MTRIAIDPGKSGAVAYGNGGTPMFRGCPDTVQEMAVIISDIIKGCEPPHIAIIEQVHSMPRDGVKSAFAFGKNFGEWLGILAANNIPTVEVLPNKWMKLLGSLPKEKNERKTKIKEIAQMRTGTAVPKYAADAVAMYLVANKITEE